MASKAKFELEIQHEGQNVQTKDLEKSVRTALKQLGYTLSHFDVNLYYIPVKQHIYYQLKSLKTSETETGYFRLEELL